MSIHNKSKQLAKKLEQIGSIDKLSDKTGRKKIRKNNKSVTLMGGLHDINRFWLIWVTMILGFLLMIWRAFYLQVAHADFYIQKADGFITSKQTQTTQRGMIVDTNGIPLAANAPLVTVIFDAHQYAESYYSKQKLLQSTKNEKTKERLTQELANMDLAKISSLSKYPQAELSKLVNIQTNLNVTDSKAVKAALPTGDNSRRLILMNKVTPEAAEPLLSLKIAGVKDEKRLQRFYLQPEPNAAILGYMGQQTDKNKKSHYVGISGLEKSYEETLAGKSGQVLTLIGSKKSLEEIKEITPKIDGQNLTLTLDSRLQYILYESLSELGRVQSARSSSGIVVDVQTGDVVAMGSWPSFNVNNLDDRTAFNERNRVVADIFEPGSVMKPFTVAAALKSGKFNVNTPINTSPGSISIGGRPIKDAANYGVITMSKLIQKSSNVASVKIALALPNNGIADIQRSFGFGKKTHLNLPTEKAGVLRNPDNTGLRATMAYGYGQQVTLAQLAQAYATLGNNGVLNPLRIIKNEEKPKPITVISPEHAKAIVMMMKAVTEQGGTAPSAAINGYHVAGKTGTSRRIVNKQYSQNEYRNIFAGLAPASNPRFAVVILVEDPKKDKYAGKTVAPVFAKVMKETLRLYNVPFDKPLDVNTN